MKGNFNYLYTFEEASKIYAIDNSTLRKRISANKFEIGKDVKKFGKTWLITEDAMIKYFGSAMLQLYKEQIRLSEIEEERKVKIEAKKNKPNKSRKSKKISSSINDDDIENSGSDAWSEDTSGIAISTFKF